MNKKRTKMKIMIFYSQRNKTTTPNKLVSMRVNVKPKSLRFGKTAKSIHNEVHSETFTAVITKTPMHILTNQQPLQKIIDALLQMRVDHSATSIF